MAKGYQPATAERTVTRCRELGWVSDERLAADRARALRARGAGALKIGADLLARGLPDEVVTAAIEASREELAEAAWARRALERCTDPRGPRGWRFLAARGFPDDVIAELLGEC